MILFETVFCFEPTETQKTSSTVVEDCVSYRFVVCQQSLISCLNNRYKYKLLYAAMHYVGNVKQKTKI